LRTRPTSLWPAPAIAAPWLILRAAHGLHTDLTSGAMGSRVVEHLSNPAPMLRAMFVYSLGKPLFWSGILLALLLGYRQLRRERFLVIAIALQLAFFIAAYLVTPHDITWHVRWSWERIVTQLAAATGFLAVVCLGDRLKPVLQRAHADRTL
jgi:predicted permease